MVGSVWGNDRNDVSGVSSWIDGLITMRLTLVSNHVHGIWDVWMVTHWGCDTREGVLSWMGVHSSRCLHRCARYAYRSSIGNRMCMVVHSGRMMKRCA